MKPQGEGSQRLFLEERSHSCEDRSEGHWNVQHSFPRCRLPTTRETPRTHLSILLLRSQTWLTAVPPKHGSVMEPRPSGSRRSVRVTQLQERHQQVFASWSFMGKRVPSCCRTWPYTRTQGGWVFPFHTWEGATMRPEARNQVSSAELGQSWSLSLHTSATSVWQYAEVV